jgi:hypothetical protein
MDFITHEVIYNKLITLFKAKDFDEEDVMNWCQEVETVYVADPNAMLRYEEIPLTIAYASGKVLLPVNIYKLRDVYNKDQKALKHRRNGRYLIVNNANVGDVIYINYIGTPIDERGIPMIHKDHQPACETYCKIQAYQEDALNNTINMNIYNDFQVRFDGMCQAAKGGFRSWDSDRFQKMNIILGNQIPRIGYMPLSHSQFKGLNVNE